MTGTAQERYNALYSGRTQFLDIAWQCSKLTLPFLIKRDNDASNHKPYLTPWQSVGAKAVVTLASKLMLALLPPQTTFFKLQVDDAKLGEMGDPAIRTELDLSFAKMERMVMDYVNASNDRVVVHQALKQLIVSGNALVFMDKENLKCFPLNRYVVDRDGNGQVLEIVTKELIARELVLETGVPISKPNQAGAGGGLDGKTGGFTTAHGNDVEVYTRVKLDNKQGRWVWHQEVEGKMIPGSRSTAPKNASPWLVLRFNSFDGEAYGRGRVEEFLGDLKSLEALSQALVEGSAAAAKVIFLVSPSSSTKAQTISQAPNGSIVQGRPDDVGVIQVGKTADFQTAYQMADQLSKRVSDAFMVLDIRKSERTTAEEVRLTQMDLEQQLGGIFSLLTDEFLKPYLNRTLMVLQRSGQLPKLPKGIVRPTIVAGVNALGRGQDRESLIAFATTIAQTMGPEAIAKYIAPDEYIKRLATAQGIEVLNLVKTGEMVQGEMQQQMQQQQALEMTKQAGQLASAPMMDPSKNPKAMEQFDAATSNGQDNPSPEIPQGEAPQGT
jgi:hypothetical protein